MTNPQGTIGPQSTWYAPLDFIIEGTYALARDTVLLAKGPPGWLVLKIDCPRRHSDHRQVGKACVCGEHFKKCEKCGYAYPGWENPHYISSVGHDTHPSDAIEPYYLCERNRDSVR